MQFALTPGDYTRAMPDSEEFRCELCLLGNIADSNVSVLKACKTMAVDVQFLGNVWGMDENAAKAAGDAAHGVVFPCARQRLGTAMRPGIKIAQEVSRLSDPSGAAYRPVHYVAAVCTALI